MSNGLTGVNRRRLLVFSGVAVAIVLSLLYFFRALIVPVAVAAFLSFLLLPIVDWAERRFRLHRGSVVIAVIFLVIATIGAVVALILPVLQRELVAVANMVPAAKDHLMTTYVPWVRDFVIQYEVVELSKFDAFIRDFRIASQFGEPGQALQQVMNQTSGVLGGVVNTALIPVFGFFLLKDAKLIRAGFETLVPDDLLPAVQQFGVDVNNTLKVVVQRQFAVAAILGVLYLVGFLIIGLPSALAVASIAGFCRIVNYADVIIGLPLALIVIVTSGFSWGLVLGVGFVFIAVQSIDGAFVTPRIIGGKVGLHPGIVIASIFAFGDWFGFGGILIAIPVVAVLKIVLLSGRRVYRESRFYLASL